MNNHNTTHGACGKTWRQRGNVTGHCAGCHETFESISLFDAHRHYADEAQTIRACKDPASMEYPKGWPLKLVNGSWSSTKPHPRALSVAD